MKELKFLLIIVLVTVMFASCLTYKITTKMTPASVTLGSDIESIILKYGQPFKTDAYMKDKIQYEKLYYKENVFAAGRNYVLTTILSFEDSVLVHFEQVEELYDSPKIQVVESSH